MIKKFKKPQTCYSKLIQKIYFPPQCEVEYRLCSTKILLQSQYLDHQGFKVYPPNIWYHLNFLNLPHRSRMLNQMSFTSIEGTFYTNVTFFFKNYVKSSRMLILYSLYQHPVCISSH